MITIGGVSSAGAASTYFAKDNYYTKAQGLGESEWFGEGAKELGLLGPAVDEIGSEMGENDPAGEQALFQDAGHDSDNDLQGLAEDTDRPLLELDLFDRADDSPDQLRQDIDGDDTAGSGDIEDGAEDIEPKDPRGVDAEDFKAVLEGRVGPDSRVGYEGKDGSWKHVAGKDVVFAPSKSVSIMALVGGDKRLSAAFQDSVKATLAFAERNYASVQDNPSKGEKTFYKTGNLTAALFTHDTSRNQDPLLHVHAIIANVTKDPRTQAWRALNKRSLYKNLYVLSSLQRADFAKRVKALGYKIEPTKHDNFELSVVPKDVRDAFSSRRIEILQKLDGEDANFKARREATLATRANKVELPRDELTQNWRSRAEMLGFDARLHVPKAPAKSKTARVNNRKAVSEAIAHQTYTETTTKRGALIAAAVAHPTSNGDIKSIEGYVDAAQASGELVVHSRHQGSGAIIYTSDAHITAEREIRDMFKAAKNRRPLAKDGAKLRTLLAKTHYINGRPVTLNPSQQAAMRHVLTVKDGYIGLQGLAGAGKTTALGVAVASLKQTLRLNPFRNPARIIGMAPTIAASRELAEKTNGSETTVQSYIQQHKHLIGTDKRPSKRSLEKYKGSVILHDESSMMSNAMQRDFMKINALLGVSKVVLIGDTGQHGAIKAGPAFKMLQEFGLKTAVMDDIMRQKNPEMLEAANAFALHDVHKGFELIKDRIHEGPDYIDRAADYYVQMRTDGLDSTLIAMDNVTRKAVNAALRTQLTQRGHLVGDEHTQPVLLPTYLSDVQAAYSDNYKLQDKLEFQKDIYKSPIQAGEVWSVEGIDPRSNTLTLALDEKRVDWKLTKLNEQPFEHLREDTLKLRQNDDIRFKQDQKDHGIRREDVGNIHAIDERMISVTLRDGRTLDLPRDHKFARRLDHSYTSTTYAMQGKTIENGIGVIDPSSRAASKEGMSVMGTRSEHSLTLFTSNKERMKARIEGQESSDLIASDAVQLSDRERVTPQKSEAVKTQDVREQVRVPDRGRGGFSR